MARSKSGRSSKKKQRKYDPFKPGFWRRHWREGLIVFLSAVALYAMSIPYDFVLDDQIVVTKNDFTKQGISGIPDIFAHDSFTGYFGEQKNLLPGSRYRPLSIATFALEYEIAGDNPQLYHLMNIIWYGLLCLLVFRIVHMFFPREKYSRWWLSVPLIAAMLFTLHPIHTEAVANIKGRDEILTLLASLAALYGAFRYAYKGSVPWLIGSGFLLLTGMMAKENAITFLAVIPAALYFFTKAPAKKIIIATLPSLIAFVAYLAIRYSVIGFIFSEEASSSIMNNPFVDMSLSEKYATIVYTLGLYLKLLVFPHPLTHDYYPYHIPIMNWTDIGVIISLVALAVLIAAAALGLRKKTVLSFSVIYFFATISIVSNLLFTVGTFMNERFVFMPSFAFCLALAWYSHVQLRRSTLWARLIPALLILYLGGYALKSATRIPAWKDKLSLNTAGVAVSKNSARINCFMGTALYQEAQQIADRDDRYAVMLEAEKYIDQSLSIIPTYRDANQMKAGLLVEHYRMDRDLPKLLDGFVAVLDRNPSVQYVRKYMEYLNTRDSDLQLLKQFYTRAGYELLSVKNRQYAYAELYLGLGLQVLPDDPQINWAVAKNYEAMGQEQKAAAFMRKARSIDPSLR